MNQKKQKTRTPANKGRKYPAEVLSDDEVRKLIRQCSPPHPSASSPPQEADAGRKPPRSGSLLRLRTIYDGNKTTTEIAMEIGQPAQGRYSSQPGGFLFDALLAH